MDVGKSRRYEIGTNAVQVEARFLVRTILDIVANDKNVYAW
jgi:hypothetical protein